MKRESPSVSDLVNAAARARREGQRDKGLEVLDRARRLDPNHAPVFCEMGLLHYGAGEYTKAADALREAVRLQPDFLNALVNLGVCYNETGDQAAAIDCYEKALLLDPTMPEIWGNLAKAWHDDDEFETSVYCYRKALERRRAGHYLRGLALAWRKTGRYDRSRALLREALEQDPDDARAHFGLAMTAFCEEHYREALTEYEWRAQLPRQQGFRRDYYPIFEKPAWRGEPLADKTLLLFTEQGFGDNLQFARFIPMIRPHVGRLVMWCRPGLGELFRQNFDIDVVTEDAFDLPGFDYQLSVLSLPRYLDPELESLRDFRPYIAPVTGGKAPIHPDPDRTSIGLVWGAEQLGYEYDNKKVPLMELASWLDIPGIDWYSLQVGADRHDLATVPFRDKLVDAGRDIGDFVDTANTIDKLDLVITVDTAVAHLAGAMGKPTWVMTTRIPDWRWQSDDGTSRWYPNARIFSQVTLNDWSGMVTKVREALCRL